MAVSTFPVRPRDFYWMGTAGAGLTRLVITGQSEATSNVVEMQRA